mmetsp:Transcript_11080/g.19253  ORF Transcript_11080/g.19253 Transcript_11080/m.19253 type:complete len:358 (+) Transcript_11080:70-1143(+)
MAVPAYISIWGTFLLVAVWYASNIATVISNKWLLSRSGFDRPVFLTLCHMIACVLLALVASGWQPIAHLKNWRQGMRIAGLSIIFLSTIVLGNASLIYIPVNFNQAIGATTPFFTALLAFVFQGAREHWIVYCSLLPVVGGVIINSHGEPLFHTLGVTLCVMSVCGRAIKTVVQSMLMTEGDKMDPMSLLFYMAVFAVGMLLPVIWLLEPAALGEAIQLYSTQKEFGLALLCNASLAYSTNLLNFMVVKYTSALTMQVLGNAKGVVGSVVAVLIFQNAVTAQSVLGYAVTVAGVYWYSAAKKHYKPSPQEPLTGPSKVAQDAASALVHREQLSPQRVSTPVADHPPGTRTSHFREHP